MRNAELVATSDIVIQMEAVYGKFDLGPEGYPTEPWENRNLKRLRLPEMLEHQHFSGFYLIRVQVNRRMMGALERVYLEIIRRWTQDARKAHGLNRFVKCYCFGDGATPSLFWYGAAWELSSTVNGETLDQVIDLFKGYGFKHDRRRLRVFEYW
jgi:hypothetical protein